MENILISSPSSFHIVPWTSMAKALKLYSLGVHSHNSTFIFEDYDDSILKQEVQEIARDFQKDVNSSGMALLGLVHADLLFEQYGCEVVVSITEYGETVYRAVKAGYAWSLTEKCIDLKMTDKVYNLIIENKTLVKYYDILSKTLTDEYFVPFIREMRNKVLTNKLSY